MPTNRSPGSDGLTSFFKSFWHIIKKDVCNAIHSFFSSGKMYDGWKETLIMIIPKVENANQPYKFRPISLCKTIYKIAANILVSRLKTLIHELISPEQGAYIPNRTIASHYFIAQEMLYKMRFSSSKVGLMMMKIDMEQAYDSMSWDTLNLILHAFNFPSKFRNWVMQCVEQPKFYILINGKQSMWIKGECGFRQGCPLSPFLFILCSEFLTSSFKAYINIGVKIAKKVNISHLLYADDILLFSKSTSKDARLLMKCINRYCHWTGQKINRRKSLVLFNKNTPRSIKSKISKICRFNTV